MAGMNLIMVSKTAMKAVLVSVIMKTGAGNTMTSIVRIPETEAAGTNPGKVPNSAVVATGTKKDALHANSRASTVIWNAGERTMITGKETRNHVVINPHCPV